MKRFLYSCLLLSACATISPSEQVSIRAAHDLRCDQSQVRTTQLDPKTVKVSGCGQEATYREDCTDTSMSTRCSWVRRDGADSTAAATQ
jgi:hypothetical protein